MTGQCHLYKGKCNIKSCGISCRTCYIFCVQFPIWTCHGKMVCKIMHEVTERRLACDSLATRAGICFLRRRNNRPNPEAGHHTLHALQVLPEKYNIMAPWFILLVITPVWCCHMFPMSSDHNLRKRFNFALLADTASCLSPLACGHSGFITVVSYFCSQCSVCPILFYLSFIPNRQINQQKDRFVYFLSQAGCVNT